MSEPTLHQFLYSHFNEKARWALDYKGIAHQRRAYLPGPHRPVIQKLSGQGQTPVLSTGDDLVIAGSARIIDYLESEHPEPSLYPADPDALAGALAVQAHYDEVVGPAVRTALFSVLINEPGYITRMFARDANGLVRGLYRATFPLARPMIAKGNGVTDPSNVQSAMEITRSTLAEVNDRVSDTGYLIGDSFSVADLSAAALLAPLALLEHPDMARPQPIPPALEAFYGLWADAPAIAWVKRQYAAHRPVAESGSPARPESPR